MRSPTPQALPALSDLDNLFPLRLLPEGHDPLADGILMAHQRAWIDDLSILKLGAKGRRTGITYCEALDDTLIAAASPSAGGDNVFYIPDVKDKGIEYIRYVAHFARVVSKELGTVQEFLFEDRLPNGDSRKITAWRVQFSSGFRVVALASRPANIRGLQGVVVIDEAAFHADVAAVIDAVNALLIWGGRIRIISSHNGEGNAFNTLIKDTLAGLYDYSIHTIPFSLAVKNGLYERVCLMRGWTPTRAGREAWLNTVLRSYGPRHEARDEELEAIPRKSSGIYLPRALVQKAQREGIPIVPWSVSETFYLDDERMAVAKRWFAEHVRPLLAGLDTGKRHVLGQDFARDGDLSVIVVAEEGLGGVWTVAFQIELRRVPFDVQRYILFEILEQLTRWLAKLDARGNGQSHAEAAQQKFGVDRIECVKATVQWYAQFFPEYRAALEDGTWLLPMGEDVIADHRLVVLRNGVPAMSDQHVKGQDGEMRHGDSAIAGLLAHAATAEEHMEYGYRPAGRPASGDGTAGGRSFWRPGDDDRRGSSILPRMRGGL
jgi:phage FluMu gp28-like protein